MPDKNAAFRGIKKYYSQFDLEELQEVKALGGDWSLVPRKVKKKILWELGINTKRRPGFWEILCKHYRLGSNRVSEGLQVYGAERLDSEWINKIVDGRRVASLEAQVLASKDWSLQKEINSLTRGTPKEKDYDKRGYPL